MASIRLDLERMSSEELAELQGEIADVLKARGDLEKCVEQNVDYDRYTLLMKRYKGWAERLCDDARYQLGLFEDAQRWLHGEVSVGSLPLHNAKVVVAGCRDRAMSLRSEISALADNLWTLKLDMRDVGIDMRFPDEVFGIPRCANQILVDVPWALRHTMEKAEQAAKGLEVFMGEFEAYVDERMAVSVDRLIANSTDRVSSVFGGQEKIEMSME